jgi:hypothetical protein
MTDHRPRNLYRQIQCIGTNGRLQTGSYLGSPITLELNEEDSLLKRRGTNNSIFTLLAYPLPISLIFASFRPRFLCTELPYIVAFMASCDKLFRRSNRNNSPATFLASRSPASSSQNFHLYSHFLEPRHS